jgi:GDP-L-fucose synthase
MRVLLTGGSGMVGSAMRRLVGDLAPDITLLTPTRAELPLSDAQAVADWFAANPVDAVIHAAARVGGIQANINHPVDFLVENLRMNDAVIMGAHGAGVQRLIFLGSSCMYPRDYRQPLEEGDVLAAPLEPTNEGYALSKITGAKLCDYISRSNDDRYYRTFIPSNLFGAEDHFGSVASHLIAAIVTKVVDARDAGVDSVEIWGSGKARREFLYSDDLVAFLLDALPRLQDLPDLLNVGFDTDHSVSEYYQMVADIAGYTGTFHHDLSKPEGMMRKCMTSARAHGYGWQPKTDMATALTQVVQAYEKTKRETTP